mgnify:FL=1|tara:strand:+ start:4189 stop:4602 length:414 start_codon:yes stop_codon:yes gene_type:complete
MVLELNKGASKQEIQAAYDRLSISLHPDRNNNSKFFIDQFDLLDIAYKNLINSDFHSSKFVKNNKFYFDKSCSIKEIFENYKNISHNFKSDLINILILNVNSDDIKYKIVLNIICEFENVVSIEKLLAFVNNKYRNY